MPSRRHNVVRKFPHDINYDSALQEGETSDAGSRRRKGFQLLLFANPVRPSLLQRIKALKAQNLPTAARSVVADAHRVGEPHSAQRDDSAAAPAGGAGAGRAKRSKGGLPPVSCSSGSTRPI
jgi:hypothetical protein